MRAAVFTALLQFKRLENLCQGALNLEEKKIIMELQSHDRLSRTRESVVTGKGVRKATAQIPKMFGMNYLIIEVLKCITIKSK